AHTGSPTASPRWGLVMHSRTRRRTRFDRDATKSASVRRSMSCIQEQPTEGVRPNARENGQIRPLDQAFELPEVLVAVSTSRLSCKRAGKTRTLMAVWDSSGESRLRLFYRDDACFGVPPIGGLINSRRRVPFMIRTSCYKI